MRHHQERRAQFGVEPAHQVQNLFRRLGIQVAGRLVGDDDDRVGDNRPGDADSLLLPAGTGGPAFLIGANYFVVKEYNFSDLYVLFVGNLADRIAGGGPFATPWPVLPQLSARDIEELQKRLTDVGFYTGAIDGKAGMATRLSLGRFQTVRESSPALTRSISSSSMSS